MRTLLLAACLTLGCTAADEGALSGSLSTTCDLNLSSTRVRLSEAEWTVEYLAGDGIVGVGLAVDTASVTLDGPTTLDLAGTASLYGRCGDFDVATGRLVLDEYQPVDGARAAGSFSLTVHGTGGERSLLGTFDEPLEDLRP